MKEKRTWGLGCIGVLSKLRQTDLGFRVRSSSKRRISFAINFATLSVTSIHNSQGTSNGRDSRPKDVRTNIRDLCTERHGGPCKVE